MLVAIVDADHPAADTSIGPGLSCSQAARLHPVAFNYLANYGQAAAGSEATG